MEEGIAANLIPRRRELGSEAVQHPRVGAVQQGLAHVCGVLRERRVEPGEIIALERDGAALQENLLYLVDLPEEFSRLPHQVKSVTQSADFLKAALRCLGPETPVEIRVKV